MILWKSFLFIFLGFCISSSIFAEAYTIDIEDNFKYNEAWVGIRKTEKESLLALRKFLKRSSTGKKLLEKAEEKAASEGLTLYDVISGGDGSLTDTTLIRKFSPSRPDELYYESKAYVFINRHHNVMDGVLDLAHELTHYTFRAFFNPYKRNFTLKEFIESTLEGKGGEVDAYIIECRVLYDLFPSRARENSNCHKVVNQNTQRLSKELGIKEFYKVGSNYRSFAKNLTGHSLGIGDFPYLSSSDSLFISSAYDLPYPVAAFKEYVTIMGKACDNDYKRLELIAKKAQRSPASFGTTDLYRRVKRLKKSYRLRCEGHGPSL